MIDISITDLITESLNRAITSKDCASLEISNESVHDPLIVCLCSSIRKCLGKLHVRKS